MAKLLKLVGRVHLYYHNMKLQDKTLAFIGVASILSSAVIANLVMVYFSIKSYDGLVEENYYKKALNYPQQEALEDRMKLMNWQVALKNDKDTYKLEVKDKNSNPITSANVSLKFFRPTLSGFDKTIVLKETSLGVYESKVELPMNGIWDVYIDIKKEKNKWNQKQRITLN